MSRCELAEGTMPAGVVTRHVFGENLPQVVLIDESTARMPRAWAVRNCFHVGPVRRGAGPIPASCRICQTAEAAIGWLSLTSSPCTRRCPHAGLSVPIWITSLRIAVAVDGCPGRRRLV